ncbi:MAG: cytochrome C oxidase subunit IV family protein [Bacteroidia bacterium]|nr:cytochrome C oxidase subunit IV family protein [Bacteroidia bacterium]
MASASANDGGASARKSIIKTALQLTALTAFEFLIAFTWEWFLVDTLGFGVETGIAIKNATFFILTIFKAFLIVAEFMHLGHEVKRLAWTIMIPFVFILWLIIGLVWEGTYWGEQSSEAISYHSVVLETDPAEEIKI